MQPRVSTQIFSGLGVCAEFLRVRAQTESLAAPLSAEDQQIQAMPQASPVKWHRAHTTWFFETFVLQPRGFAPFNPQYGLLFNSYYEALGPRHSRPQRGLLSRPSVEEITAWRQHVDSLIVRVLGAADGLDATLTNLVRLGLAHEEQHQELMQTDLLAAFACNPLLPCYLPAPPDLLHRHRDTSAQLGWLAHSGGRVDIGAEAAVPFAFDNEGPRHSVWLEPFALANRLVTVGEWLAFARDGGYQSPALWLSEGLDWVRANNISGPAYTRIEDDEVIVYGLHGMRKADADEPVLHISFYEADALATWLQARLPTEHEWEAVAAAQTNQGNNASGSHHDVIPRSPHGADAGFFHQAWQWTRSSYAPYPGFQPAADALGEYNGKFMINQQVLRGSSVFTPAGHSRASYRNFWHPQTQFQATGLRLARDAKGR